MSRRVLLPPMPPNPTVAMFTVSLGAWNPRPRTWRGRIVTPAPAAVVVLRNLRLEMSLMESPRRARILPLSPPIHLTFCRDRPPRYGRDTNVGKGGTVPWRYTRRGGADW